MWAALGLRGTWFFYDEWGMVDRVVSQSTWRSMTTTFNGHLWLLQDVIYRVQVNLFGIDRHLFVSAAFLVSLVFLHASTAAVLRACAVPLTASLLLGGLVTYLGPAAQNMVFAVQVSPTLAVAVAMVAVRVVLGGAASAPRACAVATLMVAVVCLDSGVAIMGLALSTVVVLCMWRGRHRLCVIPSLALMVLLLVFADRGPSWSGTVARRASFAVDLLLHSAGALVGSQQEVGLIVCATVAGTLFVGWHRGIIERPSRVMLVAGGVSSLLTAAAIAQTRADLVQGNFVDYNRYLQNVALPLLIAAAPACTDVVRAASSRRRADPSRRGRVSNRGVVVASMAILGAWALGIPDRLAYRDEFIGWNRQTKMRILDGAVVVTNGCPDGSTPDPASRPAGEWSPQVTTRLLRVLTESGALTVPSGRVPRNSVVEAMCPMTAEG